MCQFRVFPMHASNFMYLGAMISSKYPFFAANNGVANLSLYSFRMASLSGWFLKMISTAPLAPMTAISADGHATLFALYQHLIFQYDYMIKTYL